MAPNVIPALMIPLMAFAMYRRVRGNFGPQPIRRKRMIARIVVFVVLAGLLALTGLSNPMLLVGLAAATGLDAALCRRRTRFGKLHGDRSTPAMADR